jgi:hypothetical protein
MIPRCFFAVLVLFVAACPGPSIQHVSYPDGTPHWEYQLKDGVPNGEGRVWHPNGNLRSEGTYVHGEKHGIFRFFDDSGEFEHQALFVSGVEVWRSDDRAAEPPAEQLSALWSVDHKREESFTSWFQISRDTTPAPYFATLDSTIPHVGLEIGAGDVQRTALFASYARGRYGVYGQFLQTNLNSAGMSYSGKRTLELGGTRTFDLDRIGVLTARAGLLFPIGNDNEAGFLASAAGAEVRPSDAATSFPSAFATRTGVSLVRAHAYYVLQGDAQVDWILAGQARPLDAVLHANAGVGFGVRAAMASLQLTSAMSVSDPSRDLAAVAAGATFWLGKLWVLGTYSHAFTGPAAFTMAVGRDL